MTHDYKRKAAQVLLSILSTSFPKFRKLESWYWTTFDLLTLWSKSEGNQGVKRMKFAFSQCQKIALGEKVDDPAAFVATVGGVPKVVGPFVDFIREGTMTPSKLTVVLSVCRLTDLFDGSLKDRDILEQVRVIESSNLSKTLDRFLESFREFVPKFFKAFPDSAFSKAWNSNLKVSNLQRASTKKGPNGPSLESAHLDALTLREYKCPNSKQNLGKVLETFETLTSRLAETSFESPAFLRKPEILDPIQDLDHAQLPGKITVIPEKGAKLRLIAQSDYFTQESLGPLHGFLQTVLNGFETDYTMDQEDALARISEVMTKDGSMPYLASFDQSQCTDRFPFKVQEAVLETKFGEEFTKLVHTIMVDREFSLKLPSGSVRRVQWKTGQPMGLLASWPLMALTHHLLVQWCAFESRGRKFGPRPFLSYTILGDDIVIFDKCVADKYLRTVRELGMKINISKSHISGKGTGVEPVAEFAKVIIWRGHIIQTIKPKQVLSALKDWRISIPLFRDLKSNPHLAIKLKCLLALINKYWSNAQKLLTYLATTPSCFNGVGYTDDQPLRNKLHASLAGSTCTLDPILWYLARKVKSRSKRLGGVVESSLDLRSLPRPVWSKHPNTQLVDELRGQYGRSLDVVFDYYRKPVKDLACQILSGSDRYWLRMLSSKSKVNVPAWQSDLSAEDKENLNLWQKVFSEDLNRKVRIEGHNYCVTGSTPFLYDEGTLVLESFRLSIEQLSLDGAFDLMREEELNVVHKAMLALSK